MVLETHGRWPLVAAGGAIPVSAVAVKQPRLRPLAALLWHQTEEWVWPGGFLPWINREVLGADEDEFPLDRRLGVVINVVVGWGASLIAAAGPRGAAPGAFLYTSNVGNVGLHLSWAVRHRRYDPGVITAVVALGPTGIIGLGQLMGDRDVSGAGVGAGIASGVGFSLLLAPLLRRRLRSTRAEAAANQPS